MQPIAPPPFEDTDEVFARGIVNQFDLLNGRTDMAPELNPFRWDNVFFQRRLSWLYSQLRSIAGLSSFWLAAKQMHREGFAAYAPAQLRVIGSAGFVDIEARKILRTPELALHDAVLFAGGIVRSVVQYPGDDIVDPASESPIGSAWPDHSITRANPLRKIFHSSAADSLTAFPIVVQPPLKYFNTDAGRYRKFITIEQGGQGPGGKGGQYTTAWEFQDGVHGEPY